MGSDDVFYAQSTHSYIVEGVSWTLIAANRVVLKIMKGFCGVRLKGLF